MARNEEKHFAKLNRVYLEKQWEEERKKKPPRPKLGALSVASDIKKWLPSITEDMNFYLMQSEVACYPERKIAEFQDEIERLKSEYRAFIRKLKELDPTCDVIPWTERAYDRKRPLETEANSMNISDNLGSVGNSQNEEVILNKPDHQSTSFNSQSGGISSTSTQPVKSKIRRLALPVLQGNTELQYKKNEELTLPVEETNILVASEWHDQPLQFTKPKAEVDVQNSACKCNCKPAKFSTVLHGRFNKQLHQKTKVICPNCECADSTVTHQSIQANNFSNKCLNISPSEDTVKYQDSTMDTTKSVESQNLAKADKGKVNPLGLNYDLSDSSDSDTCT